jgi:hypothetical protein
VAEVAHPQETEVVAVATAAGLPTEEAIVAPPIVAAVAIVAAIVADLLRAVGAVGLMRHSSSTLVSLRK